MKTWKIKKYHLKNENVIIVTISSFESLIIIFEALKHSIPEKCSIIQLADTVKQGMLSRPYFSL